MTLVNGVVETLQFIGMSLKAGDIIFVDTGIVDLDSLQDYKWIEGMPSVTFIPVRLKPGETISNHIQQMSKEEFDAFRQSIEVK